MFFFFFFFGGGGEGGFFTHQCQNCPAPYLSFCHYLFLLLINYVNLIQYSTEKKKEKKNLFTYIMITYICVRMYASSALWRHQSAFRRLIIFHFLPSKKYILKPPFIFLRVHVQNTANRPTLQYNLNETNE